MTTCPTQVVGDSLNTTKTSFRDFWSTIFARLLYDPNSAKKN